MKTVSTSPEGGEHHCPVCGNFVRLDPSRPTGDCPCPSCGSLVWVNPHSPHKADEGDILQRIASGRPRQTPMRLMALYLPVVVAGVCIQQWTTVTADAIENEWLEWSSSLCIVLFTLLATVQLIPACTFLAFDLAFTFIAAFAAHRGADSTAWQLRVPRRERFQMRMAFAC